MADATAKPGTIEQIARSPDFRGVYSNVFRMRPGLADFTLIFARLSDLGSDKLGAEDQVEIYVAPTMLKLMADALQAAVQAHEETWGPIRPTLAVDVEALRQIIRQQKPASVKK